MVTSFISVSNDSIKRITFVPVFQTQQQAKKSNNLARKACIIQAFEVWSSETYGAKLVRFRSASVSTIYQQCSEECEKWCAFCKVDFNSVDEYLAAAFVLKIELAFPTDLILATWPTIYVRAVAFTDAGPWPREQALGPWCRPHQPSISRWFNLTYSKSASVKTKCLKLAASIGTSNKKVNRWLIWKQEE